MKENREIGLTDPEIMLNDNTITVQGFIPYNNYLVYSGGNTAMVYDANWNFEAELSESITLSEEDPTLTAKHGPNTFSVKALDSYNTWLSCRIKVEDIDNPIVISKP